MEFAREISIPQKLWFISIPKKLLKLMIKFLQNFEKHYSLTITVKIRC